MENFFNTNFYQTIIDKLDDGIWVIDSNLTTCYVNVQMEQLFGMSKSEIIGKSFHQLLDPVSSINLEQHILSKTSEILEIDILNKLEESFFIRLKSNPIYEDKQLKNIILTIHNSTNKQNIQRDHLSLFEDSPIPIWEEDFSQIKIAIDELKAKGITDLKLYLSSNPKELIRLSSLLKVNRINKAVVEVNEAKSKKEVLANFKTLLTENSFHYLIIQLIAIAEGKNECQFDAEIITFKGNTRHIHLRWKVVLGYESTYEKVFLTTTDLTERIKEENLVLQQSNREKEILLKEIHHRVKNNLQIISSLLRLQTLSIKDDAIKSIFDVSLNRISSMATVHEMLYRSTEYSQIDYKDYLERLILSLMNTISDQHSIKFDLKVDNVIFTIETAVPLGLLINEILTNSIKHAFDNDKQGVVYIHISILEDGNYLLEIGDNGKGIKKLTHSARNETLGLSLIESLSEQLGGSIQLNEQRQGTHYFLNFSTN